MQEALHYDLWKTIVQKGVDDISWEQPKYGEYVKESCVTWNHSVLTHMK